MKKTILEKYAKLAINSGVNVQPGQMLVINAPVEAYEFVQMCVKEAYKKNASVVEVRYRDSEVTRMTYENASLDTLSKVPNWIVERQKEAVESKCCFLSIISEVPGNLKNVAIDKLQAANHAMSLAMKPFRSYTMANNGQWSIVAYPNVKWAQTIFKDCDDETSVQKLWDAILKSVRIDEENDVFQEWVNHSKALADHNDILNKYNFEKLHFKNSLGTDLEVGLVKNHIWAGGQEYTPNKVVFNPNMPTEEVFTCPDRNNVNGVVYSTKPLSYNGKLIDKFYLKFVDGKVVEYHAEQEEATLKTLLDLDEGSKHLGEVALISHDSPISNMNILFNNTLFDENASCHLALGACYPNNIVDGEKFSEEEMLAAGGNISMNHCDFMFGSEDMEVYGYQANGEKVQIFANGNFCI